MHILWIKTEFLHPVDKGGRIRTYQMLRNLRRNHRVTYLTLDDGTAAPNAELLAREYADVAMRVPFAPPRKGSSRFFGHLLRNLLSRLPYAIERYRCQELQTQLRRLADRSGIDIIVCDFLAPSLNVPDNLGVPTVLFQHNVESMIWQRHAAVARNPLKRAYMTAQWRRMRRHEARECRRFDHVIAVSPEDAAVFRDEFAIEHVSDVPTGVDVEYFSPTQSIVPDPNELVFTGSMDWMPNADAMLWFVQKVLPLIRARVPGASLKIVGRNPSSAISALARNDSGIVVTGAVPDVRPYIEHASVFIAPLRVGGGTRLKIFEAMAMERPVVSTRVGAEGLPVRHGVSILLEDEPAPFADAVVSLLLDPQRARSIANAGATQVRAESGWTNVAERFADICAAVVDSAFPVESTSVDSQPAAGSA